MIPVQECYFVFINSFLVVKTMFWNNFDYCWWWFGVEIQCTLAKIWEYFNFDQFFNFFEGLLTWNFEIFEIPWKYRYRAFKCSKNYQNPFTEQKVTISRSRFFFWSKKKPFEELNDLGLSAPTWLWDSAARREATRSGRFKNGNLVNSW